MAKKTIEEWRLLITPLEVKDHNGKKMIVMKSSTFDKRYDSYEEALGEYTMRILEADIIESSKNLEIGGVYDRVEINYTQEDKDTGDELLFDIPNLCFIVK